MSIRRDFTNQFGAFTPTENAAIYNADHPRRLPTKPPEKTRPRTRVLREDACARMGIQADKPAQSDDSDLKRMRQLYHALCSIAGMMDCKIDSLTLQRKGEPCKYQTVGETKLLERC